MIMNKFKDNPALYRAIVLAYYDITNDAKWKYNSNEGLTDEQLAQITSINIKPTISEKLETLDGIELLPNLKTLRIESQSQSKTEKAMAKSIRSKSSNLNDELQIQDEFYIQEAELGQLKDITSLYKCTKLTSL